MEHSRFAHSIGVFHLSRRMYDAVVKNSGLEVDHEDRIKVALAGLLHDLGHGPFSHSLEAAFPKFDHEEMSIRLLNEHGVIRSALSIASGDFSEKLSPYINKKNRVDEQWTYHVISSQLDADRLDYMIRDSLHAGLKGHGFDLERLLDVISTHEGKIIVEESSMPTVEAYLLSRLHLYEIVYFHKTVRASQCLLISIFKRCRDLVLMGKNDHLENVPPVLRHFLTALIANAENIPLDCFARVGDHHCWVAFDEWACSSEDSVLRDLCRRLVSRNPFKVLDLSRSAVGNALQSRVYEVVKVCSENLKISPEDVSKYYCMTDATQALAYKAFDPQSNKPDEEIWIRSKSGEIQKLSEFTENPIVTATRSPRSARFYFYPGECSADVRRIMESELN